mgnify:CR=1 FL=1
MSPPAALRAAMKMLLIDGYFHADPHPGNLLLTHDRNLAILDLDRGNTRARQQHAQDAPVISVALGYENPREIMRPLRDRMMRRLLQRAPDIADRPERIERIFRLLSGGEIVVLAKQPVVDLRRL